MAIPILGAPGNLPGFWTPTVTCVLFDSSRLPLSLAFVTDIGWGMILASLKLRFPGRPRPHDEEAVARGWNVRLPPVPGRGKAKVLTLSCS